MDEVIEPEQEKKNMVSKKKKKILEFLSSLRGFATTLVQFVSNGSPRDYSR
jgi:hypothetical protein